MFLKQHPKCCLFELHMTKPSKILTFSAILVHLHLTEPTTIKFSDSPLATRRRYSPVMWNKTNTHSQQQNGKFLMDNALLRWNVPGSDRIYFRTASHISVLCDIVKIKINNHSKFLACIVSNPLFNPHEDIINWIAIVTFSVAGSCD